MQSVIEQLNPQQKKAVIHQQGPAVVLAGAGSGKTRVLTTRLAWLIKEKKIKPEEILLVTFTNKAANEMNNRILRLTAFKPPYSGTFHSLCCKILRQNGEIIGLENNFVIFDSNDQLSLLKQIYKKHNFDKNRYQIKKIKAIISQAKNEMLSPQQYQEITNNSFQEFVSKAYHLYQAELLKQNAVDFDDLLLLTVNLLQNNQTILNKYQQQFSHVLVDEYQDTNKAQYQLTKYFAHPQNNLYVVGDFSQSIYAWRGADYRNLFFLNQDFSGITKYKLEQNYRSTQIILDAASQIIAQNKSHPILKLWTKNKNEHKPSNKITVIASHNAEEEAKEIAQTINNKLSGYQHKDIAILYRTNAQSRAFEEAFIQAGIPYQIIGGLKFYERKEIKDLLAYLKLLINPLDQVSLDRVIKIGKRRYQAFQKLINELNQEENKTLTINPYELLNKIIKKTKYLEKYDIKDPDDANRLDNIQELLNVASQFDNSVQFLENVALIQDNQFHDLDLSQIRNSITLMSLHSAKGLEFPVIFIAGMEEGLLPHARSLLDSEKLEEERRLCYVGVTRAKERLFLSWAQKRFLNGQQNYSSASRFLNDIPEELLTHRQSRNYLYHHDLQDQSKNNWNNFYYQKNHFSFKNKYSQAKNKSKKRRIVIDEDLIDAVIKDEIDIKKFLDS
ncbi:MAG: UvrD-helicase domain-containing protein [Candidatus Woesebacteria bacterium]